MESDKEIEKRLNREAKELGYKKGVEIFDLYPNFESFEIISSNTFYYEELLGQMTLRDTEGDVLWLNGKWAKITI